MTGRAALYGFTMFLAAFLSMTVQPLVGKLLLPPLGGTPAVWSSCLVFFQAALLVGYLYAHLAPPRPRLHLAVLLLPLVVFGVAVALAGTPVPIVSSILPTKQDNPILPLLGALALAVGVPFAVLASTAPLLQRWHAGPATYTLYAASNAGSLLGLLAYPLLIEPGLTLAAQQWAWAIAAVACLALIAACAFLAEGRPAVEPEPAPVGAMLAWMGLAALPSALLTSVSAVLTTEVAPVPLLWVVPLGLYLTSFIVVFVGWPEWAGVLSWRVGVPAIICVVLVLITRAADPLWLIAALHLTAFSLLCLLCHGELVRRRPPAGQLTAFYLALSAGGVIGGLTAGLLAPVVFWKLGMVEYPLALILATLVRPPAARTWGGPVPDFNWLDVALPCLVGAITVGLIAAAPSVVGELPPDGDPGLAVARVARFALEFAGPLVATFAMAWRPWRFALGLCLVMAAGSLETSASGRPLHCERNFFGSLRVVETRDGKYIRLIHGATQHGQQAAGVVGKPKPLMYYHPTGPSGRLLEALPPERRRRVGAVGLGTGALAAHARPGESWTFFEIDPAVVRVARDPRLFNYLSTCEADWDVDLGDARRRLAARDDVFAVLLLDAFSSDAIPTHLLTREAMGLYLERLAPTGVIAFHVSNRYLDLPPLLARLADERGMALRVDHDIPTPGEEAEGKTASSWVVLARDEASLAAVVAKDPRWLRQKVEAGPVWTDQFSNILGVWRRDQP